MNVAAIFASDPLLSGDIGLAEVLIALLKTLVAFGLLLTSVIFMIWFERKLISDFQNRVGPNKAGPWGLLQTLADGLKLIMKEDLIPDKADRRVFILAPFLSAVPAFVTFAVVPIGGGFDGDRFGAISLFGHDTLVQLADPPIGVLLILAMSSIAIPRWNFIATGVVPFVIFLIAGTAELNRPPFDLVEAEQELVGGFHTEYSSVRFALFYLAEFMNVVTMSAIIVTLFLGGPNGPLLFGPDWIWPPVWFFLK